MEHLEIYIDYNGIATERLTHEDIQPHIKPNGLLDWESLEAWAKTHRGTIVEREV